MKLENLNLEIYQNKVVCPRCDGNGLIYKTLLMPLNQEIFICDECEGMWFDPKTIQNGYFSDFTTYVRSKGYTYDEVDLKNIDYGWYERDYMGKES